MIDIGNRSTPGSLSALASAGAGGDVSASAFHPATAGEIVKALATTVDDVRSCEFELPTPMSEAEAAAASVALGDSELVWGANDGWELTSPSRLRLRGSACAALKNAVSPVTLQTPRCP